MNTRAKAAFSTADTLAVAKANCAPKRNPPRSRGGSKPSDSKRKELATPTPKPKTSDKGPSDPKPAPEKTIEKSLLPSSTPEDPKKARKGRQGAGSTPPGISSLKEAVIGGKPKGDPEAADSRQTALGPLLVTILQSLSSGSRRLPRAGTMSSQTPQRRSTSASTSLSLRTAPTAPTSLPRTMTINNDSEENDRKRDNLHEHSS